MEETFNKINALYAEYAKFSAAGNTENAIKSIEEKIIIEVWKSQKKYKEFPVEVVEKVRYALLKYFHDSDDFEEEISFSQYLFGLLKKSINTSREKDDFADKNAGNTITDYLVEQINEFKKVQKKYPDLDEESIVKKATQELKIKESKIRIILKIIRASTSGTETTNEDGEVFLNPDIQENSDRNPLENWLIDKEKREIILTEFQKEWEKGKSNPMLSELITVTVLECGFRFEDLENYSFINKEIRDAYFVENSKRKLPQNQEIAEKYGFTKSAATQARKRFLEKVKDSLKNF
jgi:hypothetical protein